MRRSLEASYHTDLSSVRVHTGPRAHELARAAGAHAVTSGHDIYFARGRYAPRDEAGWRRIAHEVAHVVQQRNGPARGGSGYVPAEVEAERGADSAWAGRGVTLSQPAAGLLQREDDDASPQTAPDYRLQLDPELELLMFQQYLRFWLGATLTGGEPPDAAAEEDRAAPSPDGPMPAAALLPPVYRLPLPSEFFRPIDPLLVQPDIGAVLAPYNLRNVPLAGRDIDAASAIFQRNYSFVSGLPDLRSMAPDIVRPLIPGHWRRSIAEAFTAATLDAQLRRDHPTPIEAADLSFYRMTGVSTIYVPLPAIPF